MIETRSKKRERESKEEEKEKIINPTTKTLEKECAICMETVGYRNKLVTECGHIYCGSCMLKNIKYSNKCPMCRKELIKDKSKKLTEITPEICRRIIETKFAQINMDNLAHGIKYILKESLPEEYFDEIKNRQSLEHRNFRNKIHDELSKFSYDLSQHIMNYQEDGSIDYMNLINEEASIELMRSIEYEPIRVYNNNFWRRIDEVDNIIDNIEDEDYM